VWAVLLAVSQVVVQVADEGVGKLLRAVVLVVEIEEDVVMVVDSWDEATIPQLKLSTCSSLSGNTFLFQD